MSSAVRRLYLAFRDLKPFIADQCVSNTEVRIRGIADALGEIRYQDMAILALEEIAPQVPRHSPIDIQRMLEKELNIRYWNRSQQRLSIAYLIQLGLGCGSKFEWDRSAASRN